MKIYAFVVLSFILFSCGINEAKVNLAKRSTEKYYKFMVTGAINNIPSVFSNEFLKITDSDTLIGTIKYLQEKKGNIRTSQLIKTETTSSIDNNERETKLELSYHVLYSSGYQAKETFRFILGKTFTGKIDGYQSRKWSDDEDE